MREPRQGEPISRRAFLQLSGKALLALSAIPAASGLVKAQAPPPAPWALVPGLSPEITPIGEFYTVSKNLWDPVLDPNDWLLHIDGLVHRPYALNYRQLTSMPAVRQYVTLTCVSNEVGGSLAGNARWGGVPLADVLRAAGVREGAVDLVMEGHDQYTDSIPIDRAMRPDTLLVWEMNGVPLPARHGGPARIIVPGIYGMKNVKWITRLTVVDHDYQGFWAKRGWNDDAPVKTWSRFDLPRPSTVRVGETALLGGVAYAGDRGVNAVEFSVDGGATWHRALAKEPLSPYAWRIWTAAWQPRTVGRTTLMVRAVDGSGQKQTAVAAPPLPAGADGYHAITMNVR